MNYIDRLQANNIIFSSKSSQEECNQAKAKYLAVLSGLDEAEKYEDVSNFCRVCLDRHLLEKLPDLVYADIYTMGCISEIVLDNFKDKIINSTKPNNITLDACVEYYQYILYLYIVYKNKGEKWWRKYTKSISDILYCKANNKKSLHKSTFRLCKSIYKLQLVDFNKSLLLDEIICMTNYADRLNEVVDMLPQYTGGYYTDKNILWKIWCNKNAQKTFKYFLLDFYPLTLLDIELITPYNQIFTQLCSSVYRVLFLMHRCDGIQDIRVEHVNYYIYKDQQLNKL